MRIHFKLRLKVRFDWPATYIPKKIGNPDGKLQLQLRACDSDSIASFDDWLACFNGVPSSSNPLLNKIAYLS